MSGYIVILMYGILHAFSPDHLTAIADFSIAKSSKKSLSIIVLFAIGHGLMLFLFAKLLEFYSLPAEVTEYGDLISSSIIISMGVYLLFMVFTDRIHLNKHIHDDKEHIHIYFGKEHSHNNVISGSAFTMGALMGIGGVRGMLVTLGMLQGGEISLLVLLIFVIGVSIVFIGFGAGILYLNKKLLTNITNVKRAFAFAGMTSILVGSQILLA